MTQQTSNILPIALVLAVIVAVAIGLGRGYLVQWLMAMHGHH